MTSAPLTRAHIPGWFDSLLFLVLMSGPPKFRDRDPFASLAGTIDLVVVFHVALWACGGFWVIARLFPSAQRRGVLPSINPVQVIAALFIASLTLSLWESPGILLTTYTVGQFAIMLGFTWIFTHRFGTSACLRHLFIGASVLALMIVAAAFVAPELVMDGPFLADGTRLRGDNIADTGSVAVIGLVFCLSSLPPLRGPMFWGALSLFGALLAASRTRSAYGAFLVFLVLGFLYGKRLRVRRLFLPLATVGLTVVFMDALPTTVEYLVRERDTVETMSDRIPLWQHLTTVVMRDSPITGLGYYAASRVEATAYNPLLGNAHSVFFEVLVGGGLLGAGLYLALCGSLVWFALHLLRIATGRPSTVAAVGLLAVSLTMGITTPAALQPGPMGFAFWSLTALLPELWREAAGVRIADKYRHVRNAAVRTGQGRRVAVMNRQAG